MLKIVTWNVNSIRARAEQFVNYINNTKPDILLLQELKCQEQQFPFALIHDLGYHAEILGQKTYNGVAIISKYPCENTMLHLPNYSKEEARYIETLVSYQRQVIRVASIYVPNGYEVYSDKFTGKMKFFHALYDRIKELLTYDEILVLGGDYNVAPSKNAMYDFESLYGLLCCHQDEINCFRRILNLGLESSFDIINPTSRAFSWWNYKANSRKKNHGLRIDHLLLSPAAIDLLANSYIDDYVRDEQKPSDHAPVVCELTL